jgi:hypothetical protein
MKLFVVTILLGLILAPAMAGAITVKNESKIEQSINVSVNSGGNVIEVEPSSLEPTQGKGEIRTGDVKTEINSQTVLDGQTVESINKEVKKDEELDEVVEYTDQGVYIKTEIKVEQNANPLINANDANGREVEGLDPTPLQSELQLRGTSTDKSEVEKNVEQGEISESNSNQNVIKLVLAFFENIFSSIVNWFSGLA